MIGIFFEETFRPVGLFDDVARDDALGNLVFVVVWVEINAPFELCEHFRFAGAGELCDVFHVNVGITIHTGSQRSICIGDLLDPRRVERYGMIENIGLVQYAVFIAFQGENLVASGIHLEEVDIRRCVEFSEAFREIAVEAAQHFTQRRVRLLPVRFDVVKVVIGVAQFDIDRCFHALFFGQLQRMKHRAAFQIAQVADPALLIRDPRAFAVMFQLRTKKRPWPKLFIILFRSPGLSGRNRTCETCSVRCLRDAADRMRGIFRRV